MTHTPKPSDGTHSSGIASRFVAKFNAALKKMLIAPDGTLKGDVFGLGRNIVGGTDIGFVLPYENREWHAMIDDAIDPHQPHPPTLLVAVLSQLAQNDSEIFYHLLGCMKQRGIATEAFEAAFTNVLSQMPELHPTTDFLARYGKKSGTEPGWNR